MFNKDNLILIGGSGSATRQYLYVNKTGDDVTTAYYFSERDLGLGDQITVVSGTSNINRATYTVTDINNLDATVTLSTVTFALGSISTSGKIETTNTTADSIKTAGQIVIATKTPITASDTGIAGTICWDANYTYVCVATNTWKRTAIATW